jgi:hypothetical protein
MSPMHPKIISIKKQWASLVNYFKVFLRKKAKFLKIDFQLAHIKNHYRKFNNFCSIGSKIAKQQTC